MIRHIMETEKVHSIKHCHVDVTNYANPINCSCDGPEGGHKTWVHEQGLWTNQGSSSAKTLMTHSLNKEAPVTHTSFIERTQQRQAICFAEMTPSTLYLVLARALACSQG